MMKLNRHIWLLAVILGIAFVACKEDDTEISTITSFDKFSTTLPAPIVVAEADAEHTINLTFDDKQIMDVHISIATSDASTATEGVDFDLSTHELAVSALERTASFDIIVHADYDPEGDETVVLRIEGIDDFGLPTPVESLVMTIRDSIYPASIVVDWEGEYQDSAGVHSLCDDFDIDMFLADADGNFVGGFGGATGNCPETMRANVPDGTYDIVVNMWANGATGSPGLIESPIYFDVRMFRGGIVNEANSTIGYNTADFAQVPVWTTFTPSDEPGEFLAVIGQVRVQGGQYTLVNPAGGDEGTL
jgi:hypothetical protein